MLDSSGKVIYVGKAQNLKKRVSSYFQKSHDLKTTQLVSKIETIEVTVTRNDREALLLENNLIKQLRPKYNIIFKDDKSYPYIFISTNSDFPEVGIVRGKKGKNQELFGPYPSTKATRKTLELLQRVFKVRQCTNSFFKNRSRPCLQYQIKRCSAPCVNYISKKNYAADILNLKKTLKGQTTVVINDLIKKMDKSSIELDYEMAAVYRDQISSLRVIQEQQVIVDANSNSDIDVLGVALDTLDVCVHVLCIRDGIILGSKQYFVTEAKGSILNKEEILSTFLIQHYLELIKNAKIPQEIILPIELKDINSIKDLLEKESLNKIKISFRVRGDRAKWLDMAMSSAKHSLKARVSSSHKTYLGFLEIQEALNLEELPKRIECFDVSHHSGEGTNASCVVFDSNGPQNSLYRRYNMKKSFKGDDYGALLEALNRHYSGLKLKSGKMPDLLIIDGGKGQLTQAEKVLNELQIEEVVVLGVAKGAGRKLGLETIYLNSKGDKLDLSPSSNAFAVITAIRDEAHRFAINAMRNKTVKTRLQSKLETIPGIGEKRRLELLKRFGGLAEVKKASIEELTKVPSISKSLAERIYNALHGS